MARRRHRNRWIAAMVSAALLAACWALVGPRELGGPLTLVSTHGDSMLPAYEPSDLVAVRATTHVEVGDVVAYHSNKLDTTVLHRIVGHDDDRLVLSGDNNTWLDPDRPTPDHVIGRAWFHVPNAGRLLELPPAIRAALGLGAIAAAGGLLRLFSRRHTAPQPRKGSPMTSRRRTSSEWARPALLGAVATLVLCGALAGVAFTRPTTQPGPVSYTHHGEFSYHADAPPGPVYPDGKVTTGDVVYRRLVDQLAVTFTYRLATDADTDVSGQVQLAANVADGSGWSRTIPTDATATVDDGEATLEATIDIQRMQGRIDAFADAAGVSSTSQTLTLAPTVTVDGTLAGAALSDQFAPTLAFRLDELTLQPAENTASQKEGDTDPVASTSDGDLTAPHAEPATLTLLGRTLDVDTARRVSTVGGSTALLATLVLGGVLARAPRQNAHDRALTRHKRLILPAQHVDVPPGRTVVDVADLDTLARLAAHHQGVILRRQDHDADLYLLEHHNTIYRLQATRSGNDAPGDTPHGERAGSVRSTA